MTPSLHVRVIGAGVIGLSVAWKLTAQGARVTVFDAERAGNGASWAAAGMLAPGGEIEQDSPWTGHALRSLELYSEFVAELERESGLRIDFRRCGAFTLAYDENEALELRRRAEAQTQLGIYSEQFPPSRVPGVREGAVAAQYYPFDSVVNPRDLLHCLQHVLRRAGADMRERQPVSSMSEDDPFDVTVLAAGAWSINVGTPLRLPETKPVRGHLVSFDDRTGLCDTIVRRGHTYLSRRSDNLVIAGSSMEDAGYDRTIDGGIAAEIAARAAWLAPHFAGRSYTAWNGIRPYSDQPAVQQLAGTRIWTAYGHFRNGVLLAPVTAEMVVRDIMQASSQTGLLSPAASQL